MGVIRFVGKWWIVSLPLLTIVLVSVVAFALWSEDTAVLVQGIGVAAQIGTAVIVVALTYELALTASGALETAGQQALAAEKANEHAAEALLEAQLQTRLSALPLLVLSTHIENREGGAPFEVSITVTNVGSAPALSVTVEIVGELAEATSGAQRPRLKPIQIPILATNAIHTQIVDARRSTDRAPQAGDTIGYAAIAFDAKWVSPLDMIITAQWHWRVRKDDPVDQRNLVIDTGLQGVGKISPRLTGPIDGLAPESGANRQ